MIAPTRTLRLALSLTLGLACAESASAADGGLGSGWTLGESGFRLGGYAEASYRDLDAARPEAALQALSAFVWWEGASRWSFFTEIELEDALVVRRGDTTTDEADLELERLYLDYAWSDALQFRAGKFLTPIGRWNQIHAAPLTWTPSRPLITEATFPTNATGLMARGVYGLAAGALEWSFFASSGAELVPDPDLDTFSEAFGLRLDYDTGRDLRLGFSFSQFEQESEREVRKALYGVDLAWNFGRLELLGEWAVRSLDSSNSKSDERGYYLQAAVPLVGELFAVGRYESFDPAEEASDFHLHLGGLAWRWQPGRVLKAEFSRTIEDSTAAHGFRASLAFLF